MSQAKTQIIGWAPYPVKAGESDCLLIREFQFNNHRIAPADQDRASEARRLVTTGSCS
jgi:hypothetical protein